MNFLLSVPRYLCQEWSADLNRTLSRREKKKTADGVTLTGINQTGDQALQNKPSRWAVRQPTSSAELGCPTWDTRRLPPGALQGTPGHLPTQPGCPSSARQWPRGVSGENDQSTWCRNCRQIQRGSLCHKHALGPERGQDLMSGVVPACPQ